MINFKEQVKKAYCYQKLFWLFEKKILVIPKFFQILGLQPWIFKKTCIERLVLFDRCIVYLKYSCTKKRAKNVQKRVKTCKNVHLKYPFIKKTCKNMQKHAKTCKIVQKCAKTCISNIFGPNSKTCTCEVRAAWGPVSRGLTVLY